MCYILSLDIGFGQNNHEVINLWKLEDSLKDPHDAFTSG
jgi:hypothetical protein